MTDYEETFYSIRCNGTTVHINPETAQLDAEWGSEQCEGCGEDIVATGVVEPRRGQQPVGALLYGSFVRCDCGATYHVDREDR